MRSRVGLGSKRKELEGRVDELPLKKQKTLTSNAISFKTTFSELLIRCETNHRCNLDKLYGGKLCVSCDEYYTKREMYLKSIENSSTCLESVKYILLSYLIHSDIKYHTKLGSAYPKYQLMMDAWYQYTVNNKQSKQSIGILKKTMKTFSVDGFMDVLIKLQPWITVKELSEIIQYQLENTGKQLLNKNQALGLAEDFVDKSCKGCCNLIGTHSRCWICHMAVKAFLLLYFTTNLYENGSYCFVQVEKYIHAHSVQGLCDCWSIRDGCASIKKLGHHPIKKHVINQMRNEQVDKTEYLLQPPIITKDTLVSAQEQMMKSIVDGYSYISNYSANINQANGCWLADESGKVMLNII